MFRRGKNLLQKVLNRSRWIDAFPVGTIVSPVLMTDDHYFTGQVVEVQPKINKVFVSWDGGSQPTQHDPDELEPIYPCTAPAGASHTKTASAKTASMTDYEYQCATAIRNALVEEHAAVAVYEELAQFAQDGDLKTIAESIAAEEKVHIGELTDLLDRYTGNELEKLDEGVCETSEILDKEDAPALEPVPENVVIEGMPVTAPELVPPAVITLLASDGKGRTKSKYRDCTLKELAKVIREDFAGITPEADLYVGFFERMDDIGDRVGNYDGVDVVQGFLENSSGWKTPTGTSVRKELKSRIKLAENESEI